MTQKVFEITSNLDSEVARIKQDGWKIVQMTSCAGRYAHLFLLCERETV